MGDLRIGSGTDVHPFTDDVRPLVIGGVTIPDAPGLAGDSDADVAAHALTDAILGALALGDLGSRFGVGDPAVAGADSCRLLADVVAEVAERGWVLGNADVTVLAQRPRLGPYRQRMAANLAEACGVDVGRMSVKFTTTDHLGFVGRVEGIAATATVLLQRD